MSQEPLSPLRTRLKVCCIASVAEAQLAIHCGADALGLVASMPSGPGPIPDELIAEIADHVPPPIASFLLTSETKPAAITDHIERTRVNTVQIVDDEVAEETREAIRKACPSVRIVQVVHVRDDRSADRALQAATTADAVLLDSGHPNAQVRELGGTGRVHNWDISRKIVALSPVPVFLAGGIHGGNVAEAIKVVRPYGIDLCSGVREDGCLSSVKLMQLVNAMKAADAESTV